MAHVSLDGLWLSLITSNRVARAVACNRHHYGVFLYCNRGTLICSEICSRTRTLGDICCCCRCRCRIDTLIGEPFRRPVPFSGARRILQHHEIRISNNKNNNSSGECQWLANRPMARTAFWLVRPPARPTCKPMTGRKW